MEAEVHPSQIEIHKNLKKSRDESLLVFQSEPLLSRLLMNGNCICYAYAEKSIFTSTV